MGCSTPSNCVTRFSIRLTLSGPPGRSPRVRSGRDGLPWRDGSAHGSAGGRLLVGHRRGILRQAAGRRRCRRDQGRVARRRPAPPLDQPRLLGRRAGRAATARSSSSCTSVTARSSRTHLDDDRRPARRRRHPDHQRRHRIPAVGHRAADPAALHERFPQLVVVSITPYGLEGPYADRPATELTLQAESGALSVRGRTRPRTRADGRAHDGVGQRPLRRGRRARRAPGRAPRRPGRAGRPLDRRGGEHHRHHRRRPHGLAARAAPTRARRAAASRPRRSSRRPTATSASTPTPARSSTASS